MWFVFGIFAINMCGSFTIIDFITRCNLNDSIVSSFYLMWTFLYYLAPFLLLTSLLYLNITCKYMNNLFYIYIIIPLLLSLLIFIETTDFTTFNSSIQVLTVSEISINILLINMLNRYHPFIFYLSVFTTIMQVFLLTISRNRRADNFNLNFKNETFTHYNSLILIFITIAIHLGAWWADQEGSWGGWWNSDSSEMLSILILLAPTILLHLKTTPYDYFTNINITNVLFILTISFYYFLQINYELVSHNFGSKFFFFFNNNLWAMFIIVINCVFLLYNFNKKYKIKLQFIDFLSSNRRVYDVKILSIVLLLIWFIISVNPIISMFIRGYQNEQDDFLIKLYLFIKSIVYVVILLTFFTTWNITKADNIILFFYDLPVLVYTVFLNLNITNKVSLLHWIIICFLGLNICTDSLVYLYYNTLIDTTFFLNNQRVYFFDNFLYLCDGNYFYQFIVCDNELSCIFNTQSLLSYCNSFEYEKMGLIFNNNSVFNLLPIYMYYNPFLIFIEYAEEGFLNMFLVFTFFVLIAVLKNNISIIFLFY